MTSRGVLPLIDGIWLKNGWCVPITVEGELSGKRVLHLGEKVPIASLPKAPRYPYGFAGYAKAPAFAGELPFGWLENGEAHYGFAMLIPDQNESIIPFVMSVSASPGFQSAEIHGTHLILTNHAGERWRVILAEDFSSVSAEIL